MKGAPAVRPVVAERFLVHLPEGARDPRTPVRVGVRDELELASALTLFEPTGLELEHEGARLLSPLERHADGDAAQTVQRKALLSFSKNPSSGR